MWWMEDTLDSVAGTLFCVKPVSNLGWMVCAKVDAFDFGGTAFNWTCSGLDLFFSCKEGR